MCWYKPGLKRIAALLSGMALVAGWPACKPDVKDTGQSLKYFDISDYFTKDAIRLTNENRMVFKTVIHNRDTESKKVHIADWGLELSLFKEADINRPAWKNSYKVIDEDSTLIYMAKYPELKMREMIVKKGKGKIKWILIYNKTKNILYQSTEKLSYFPDSLYSIKKDQRVRLTGNNRYRIQGVLER